MLSSTVRVEDAAMRCWIWPARIIGAMAARIQGGRTYSWPL